MKFKMFLFFPVFLYILLNYFCSIATEKASLTEIRFGSDTEKTRLAFDLSKKVSYTICRQGNPDIFIIEFPGTEMKKNIKKIYKPDDNLIEEITFEKTAYDSVITTIKLKYNLPSENYKAFNMENPDRLVFDFYKNFDEKSVTYLSESVIWARIRKGSWKGVISFNVVIADLERENINLKAIQAKDNNKSRETTSSMAQRTGALVAVNGGYYNKDGGPLGLVIIDGILQSPHVAKRPPRTALGVRYDKKILIDRIKAVNDRVISLSGKDWTRVIYAIGAGPNLITDGKINITAKEEELGPGGNDVTRRAGHTALGITKDNKLVLFSVDDRKSKSTESLGMNLTEIAEYLLKLNVTDAINMDGGDSTTMVIEGKLISETYSPERKVANCWSLFDTGNSGIAPASINVNQTGYNNLTYSLDITVTDGAGNPVPDGTGVRINSSYGVPKPSFTVTKNGKASIKFASMKAGAAGLYVTAGTVNQEFNLSFQ